MGDEASIVTGFDLGADDYIAKPFKPLELISRVKNPAVFRISDVKIDTVRAHVIKSGRGIILSALEYRLLLVFLKSELYKRTLRLREQAEVLKKDKVYLSDSIADISLKIVWSIRRKRGEYGLERTQSESNDAGAQICG